MRVSDWSSDVCFSDRRKVRANDKNAGERQIVDLSGQRRDIADGDADARDVHGGAYSRHRPGHRLHHQHHDFAGRADGGAQCRQAAGLFELSDGPAVRALAAAVAERVIRSEEHTSELQYIMRISYAVFSLKKKKN